MKHFALSLLLVPAMPCFAEDAGQKVTIDWVGLGNAFREYQRRPGSKNAQAIWKLVPDRADAFEFTNSKDEEEALNFMMDSLIPLLEKRMRRGDKSAMRLAFRLFPVSDGHITEMLDVALGDQIVRQPRLFLRMLKEHKRTVLRLDALLGNTGIYDDLEGDCKEMCRRHAALKSVEDRDLAPTRDEAMRELENQLGHYCKEVSAE